MPACTRQRMQWFAEHVLPHEPALRAWLSSHLYGRLGESLEADDVVQETWATLTAMDDVGGIRNPRAYLFTVARSIVLQHVRRARIVSIEAVADIEQMELPDDRNSPERRLSAHQELRRLSAQLATLPERCRKAFVLRKVHGLSQREIARVMGISESTVEKHIGKALRIILNMTAQADAAGRENRRGGDNTEAGSRDRMA